MRRSFSFCSSPRGPSGTLPSFPCEEQGLDADALIDWFQVLAVEPELVLLDADADVERAIIALHREQRRVAACRAPRFGRDVTARHLLDDDAEVQVPVRDARF